MENKRYHWAVVFTWVLIALICAASLPFLGKPFKLGGVTDPAAESTQARKIMEKELPFGGSRVIIIFKSKNNSIQNSIVAAQIKKSLSRLNDLPFEMRVVSPYQNAKQISDNNRVAYAVIKTNMTTEQLGSYMDAIRQALGKPKNVEMYIGGEPAYTADVYKLSESNLIRGELIALPICFVVMIGVFAGIIPALITIFTGIISITIIITILYILGNQMDLTVFVLNISTMLGLSLGLDYALLLTYRFREEYLKCKDSKKTLSIVLSTGGLSILFSGIIVLISIASLIFFPINVLFSLGVAGIVLVIVTMACSLTFLPSMLCLLDKNIVGVISPIKKISAENIHDHRWYRFFMLVMKYPLVFIIPTIFVLLLLGYPFLSVKLNSPDAKILPTTSESRKVLDFFESSFNPQELTPIEIVFTSKNKSILGKNDISALYDYAKKLQKDNRVDKVYSIVTINSDLNKAQYQAIYKSPDSLPFTALQKQSFSESTKKQYTVMSVIGKYSKYDKRNSDLIHSIRTDKLNNHMVKQVTGVSAEIIDTIDTMYKLFFKFLIIISIVTYFTLMCLLRSLILPLKAILMNMLSLSVCYGMLVYIFQEGHFARFLHFSPLGFTDMTLPILLFFVLFGLSMDYEVFILSRIKEYYDQTGDNEKSVAMGLERSARIISSAALIIVIVSGAFVTADIIFIKAFGLGAALAIAVDASLIRLLLVPATMRLLGRWNWYLPKWLDKLLPHIHLDKHEKN